MGTEKRARQKSNRQARLQAALEEQKKAKQRRTYLRFGGIVAAAMAFFLVFWLLNRGDSEKVVATDSTATSGSVTTKSGLKLVAPPLGKTLSGETPCPKADGSEQRVTTFAAPPPMCIDASKTYKAKITTSIGELTITFDAKKAPKTVNNFVVLSRYHYYDGVPFHRIVPGFVAQAGDGNPKTELGTGGPGYTFADELPKSVDEYVAGSVAMANSGANTNGSQFFFWYGPTKLPSPAYALFGQVTEGFDTVGKELLALGTESQKPSKIVTIDKIEISES